MKDIVLTRSSGHGNRLPSAASCREETSKDEGRTFFFFFSEILFLDCLQTWEDIAASFIRITCFEFFSMILMYFGTSATFFFK